MKAYHIRNWVEKYENHESRKLAAMRWYPKSTKIFGIEMRLLSLEEKASAILGAWTLMEMIAASSEPRALRGWVICDGRTLDAQGLSFLTNHPREDFDAAI